MEPYETPETPEVPKAAVQDVPHEPLPPEEGDRMKMLRRVLVGLVPVLLVVGVAVGLLMYSPASEAKKKVELGWSPDPLVTESIAPEEEATYSVVMTNLGKSSIAPTHQLEIVAEGGIASYVSIQQPQFSKDTFQSGEEVAFEVTVSVPVDAPIGVSYGTLFLRRVLSSGKVKEEWREEALSVDLFMKDEKGRILVVAPGCGRCAVNQFRLALSQDAGATAAEELATLVNGTIVRTFPRTGVYVIQLETTSMATLDNALEVLRADPRVDYVSKEILPFLTSFNYDLKNLRDQNLGHTTAYDAIFLESAWNLVALNGVQPEYVAVGIFDSGVDTNHPEFDFVDWVGDALEDLGDPADKCRADPLLSHGTQVAGIIGANNLSAFYSLLPTNNPQMNGVLSGLATQEIPRGNYSLGFYQLGSSSDIEDQIEKAYTAGFRVFNFSFAFSSCRGLSDYPTNWFGRCYLKEDYCLDEQTFIDSRRDWEGLFSEYSKALFVVSAGNMAIPTAFSLPAGVAVSADNVIAVAASSSDGQGEWQSFSNGWYLDTQDDVVKGIDIAAPGGGVYAPRLFSPPAPSDFEDYDKDFGGTSSAAPFVSGVVAMMMSVNGKRLTPRIIKGVLSDTASLPCDPGERNGCLLNAEDAVACSLDAPPLRQIRRDDEDVGEQVEGEQVELVSDSVIVRDTPSGNAVALGSIGASGELIEGPRCVGEYWWWQVDFESGVDGWVAEDFLQAATPSEPPEAPSFTSTPVTNAQQGIEYNYPITATDPNAGDTLTITGTVLPAWLTLTDNGDRTATLVGIPGAGDVGDHLVSLQVSDEALQDTQQFTITVVPQTSTTFAIGDAVEVTADAIPSLNVREAADGSVIGTQPPGARGVVIVGPTYAGGYWWWQVDFESGVDGWVAEEFLQAVPDQGAECPPSTAVPGTACFYSLKEGNPGVPGDSIYVDQSVTGFHPETPLSLIGVTDGLRLTVYSEYPFRHDSLSYRLTNRPVVNVECSSGTGTGIVVGAPILNGVGGLSWHIPQERLEGTMSSMRDIPSCAGVDTLDDVYLQTFFPGGATTLDALSIGYGFGAFPDENTPGP